MSLFSYFYLGVRSMNVAQLGLQVAGDNIANATTPGYARRRLELVPGPPIQVPGGQLDQGVDVAGLRRMEDLFLQTSLQREQGNQAGSEELLRGLYQIEGIFGTLESGSGIASALSSFSAAFDGLAAQPENPALRREAISSADGLARTIREIHTRLSSQRNLQDQAVGASVDAINGLSVELADLNREIAIETAAGGVPAPLLDRRTLVIEELSRLTGGTASGGSNGRIDFSLPGGPTLVAGDTPLALTTSRATDGTLRVQSGANGADVTDRVRQGRLGSQLQLRDDVIVGQLNDLDSLAADFITRVNGLTSSAFDLQGNPGTALFLPDPPAISGAAAAIAVDPALLQDPTLLAVSSTGAPGEGDVALLLSGLPDAAAAALNGNSTAGFFSEMTARLGNQIVETDVTHGVAQSLVQGLQTQRDAVSGVSLDEEAVELIRNQRSFEAAARFIQVLNEVTEVAVNLVGR